MINLLLILLLLVMTMGRLSHSFSSSASLLSPSSHRMVPRISINKNCNFIIFHAKNPLIQFMTTDSDDTISENSLGNSVTSSSSSSSARSLEEKMKSWEASEEEMKAATLGGMVPGTRIGACVAAGESAGRTDAFDVGLYIAFPIMILSCLAVSSFFIKNCIKMVKSCAHCSCSFWGLVYFLPTSGW